MKHKFGSSWNIILSLLFFGLVFIKICLFQYQGLKTILVSSIINDPETFWAFYLPKIAAALFLTALLFLFKNKWWSCIFNYVFDFWILANLIYLRSNHLVLDAYALLMADNMDGFWNSIFGLLEWKDLTYFILSTIYLTVTIILKPVRHRNILLGLCLLVGAVSFQMQGMYHFGRRWAGTPFYNPFGETVCDVVCCRDINKYCYNFSVLHLAIYDVCQGLRIMHEDPAAVGQVSFSKEELALIENRIERDENAQTFQMSVVIILIESMESWAVVPEIMPNFYAFTAKDHILYADKVLSQIAGGTSADGQLIINTGLLPVISGATCYRFPKSTYPGIAKNSEGKSITLVPHALDVWNQSDMSCAYGYDECVQVSSDEEKLFSSVVRYVQDGYGLVHTFTLSSHIPFEKGSSLSDLELPHDMPKLMSDYLKSMNYVDSILPIIFSQTMEGGTLEHSTVVITGDHTIFHEDRAKAFEDYARGKGYGNRIYPNYCPLLIISPDIEENTKVEDICYQMDIYPTVRSIVGDAAMPWKGFGVDLLSPNALLSREIEPETASTLSDKMIKSDYFKNFENE